MVYIAFVVVRFIFFSTNPEHWCRKSFIWNNPFCFKCFTHFSHSLLWHLLNVIFSQHNVMILALSTQCCAVLVWMYRAGCWW